MRRTIVLGVVLVAGALTIGVRAYQQPGAGTGGGQGAQTIEVEKLDDRLFVLRGGGGNTAVFIREDGVTVVDTKNPGWGKPLIEAIRKLTDKPVTLIVNTHTHGDHVSGNVEFPAGTDVVVHENTRDNMSRMVSPPGFRQPSPGARTIFEENGGRGLPTRTFDDRLTIGSGDDRIELYHFGRGHTNGDAIVVFPAHRAMHMGDLFPGKQIPIIDTNNGGSGLEYAVTLRNAHDGVEGVATIITGHGPLMSPKDLLEYSEFIRDFVEAVRASKKAGRSVEEAAGKWTAPARYAGYAAPQPDRLRANVVGIYTELD